MLNTEYLASLFILHALGAELNVFEQLAIYRHEVRDQADHPEQDARERADRRGDEAGQVGAPSLRRKKQQPEPAQGLQEVSLRTEQVSPPPGETEKVPVPVASPVKQAARIKAAQCAKNQFSCEWPRLSEKVNELKRLFNPQQQQQQQAAAKQKKG